MKTNLTWNPEPESPPPPSPSSLPPPLYKKFSNRDARTRRTLDTIIRISTLLTYLLTYQPGAPAGGGVGGGAQQRAEGSQGSERAQESKKYSLSL